VAEKLRRVKLLDRGDIEPFARREKDQGRHLNRALSGRQRFLGLRGGEALFPEPSVELRALKAKRQLDLNPGNAHARMRWMRTWGGYFCDQVGASPPDWVPDVPVYLVTVSDQRQTVFVGEPDPQDVGRRNPSFSDIRHYYANHMLHVRYFGMLEPALYAYSEGIFGVPFALHWHLHALAWGHSDGELEGWAYALRRRIRPVLSYATSVDIRPVRDGDLLQLIWYISKMPREQYQLWERPSGSIKQYTGRINGYNAVRLHHQTRQIDLLQRAMAGRGGKSVLRRATRDFERWRTRV
jgi:hypothetical protein